MWKSVDRNNFAENRDQWRLWWTRWITFGLDEMRGILWLATKLLASQEVLINRISTSKWFWSWNVLAGVQKKKTAVLLCVHVLYLCEENRHLIVRSCFVLVRRKRPSYCAFMFCTCAKKIAILLCVHVLYLCEERVINPASVYVGT